MVTEKECKEALSEIEDSLCELEETKTGVVVNCLFDENLETIKQLIEEHFSNPPLYMDEIPKGIWIWDNVNKECIRSLGCVELNGIIYVKFERSENSFITNYLEYEPNRFYRKEVRNVK